MRDENVIRVDFKNKKQFGGLKISSDLSNDNNETLKIDNAKSITDEQSELKKTSDTSTPAVIVDQQIFNELITALMFYAHSTAGLPGWDNGVRAKKALAPFASIS